MPDRAIYRKSAASASRGRVFLSLIFLAVLAGGSAALAAADYPLETDAVVIRDPFVLPHEGVYYLYGTGRPGGRQGFYVYESRDLRHWKKPVPVFLPDAEFPMDRDFWAPEVRHYQGRFYLFGTAAKAPPVRGTWVLVSDQPAGPFRPHTGQSLTPEDRQCLDGTLYIDPEGRPWMVFCHEWTQVDNGEMQAVRLSKDLRARVGAPVLLFHASDAPWVNSIRPGKKKFVTDGPWLRRLSNGQLLMLWSSFTKPGNYAVGMARSRSGAVTGPWEHAPDPLFEENGGHPMLFRTFDGQLMLALHQPNDGGPAHPRFLEVRETGFGIEIITPES
jgi:arabinan endo-1,5-alpha-L-arabinosidase